MERLTIRDAEGQAHARFVVGYYDIIDKLAEYLAEYEDAEEQGLLLRLPCKVGDAIYIITGSINEDGTLGRAEVDVDVIERISIRKNTKVYTGRYSATYEEEFGRTAFLTKEEAEQKLEEILKGGGVDEVD